jgi:hypothetical protein
VYCCDLIRVSQLKLCIELPGEFISQGDERIAIDKLERDLSLVINANRLIN